MKDFLFSMIAFKVDNLLVDLDVIEEEVVGGDGYSASGKHDSVDDQCFLYFQLFDFADNGFIDPDELKLMAELLLEDRGVQSCSQQELFDVMDLDQNGQISYEEFKKFYAGVLAMSDGASQLPPLVT